MSASEQTEAAKAMAEVLPLVKDHPSIHAALVAAVAELTVVEKARTAKIDMKGGGSYSYDFADLADVVKLTRPILARHGLVALTPVHAFGNRLACTVRLVWSGGEVMDMEPFPFPEGADARATGSFVTYHRRYALVAALGMATGEDDDGAAAQPRQTAPLPQLNPMGLAKRKVLELAQGDKSLAKDAWEYMEDALAGTDYSLTVAADMFAEFMSPEPPEDSEDKA